MDNPSKFPHTFQANDLTWREQEVLTLLSKRMTNREIADHLNLAENTVKDYVGKILSKLYVRNRREAVDKAIALGILGAEDLSPGKFRSNLPTGSTHFIGRESELQKIEKLLRITHLVTITGPGGAGKTRLAIKGAKQVEHDYKDGTYFVALAAAQSGEDIVQAISEAIGFPISTPGRAIDQLLRYLKNRQMLLILDNFEHLIKHVDIINEIQQSAVHVKMLATSQEKLNLQSETVFAIEGLGSSSPDIDASGKLGDAVALFLHIAKKVNPEYDPAESQQNKIIEICKSVDGMPLAVELAASWLHVLTEDEIVSELEKGLDILETEARDIPSRHRSMRSVFDHSWSLLSETERELFKSLSVFQGGFTLQAAVSVAGATVKQLARLVNKSFIRHDLDSARYEIHELLRHYAQVKLGSNPQNLFSLQEAHAAYFADFMKSSWPRLRSSEQIMAVKKIEADLINVRIAWDHFISQVDAENIGKFLDSLWFIYLVNGWNLAAVKMLGEAATALQDDVDDDESRAVMALAMGFKGYFMAWLGLSEEGFGLSQESERILVELDRPLDEAKVLDGLSLNSYYLARLDEEERAMRRIHEIAIKFNDDSLQAYSLFLWSLISFRTKNFKDAKEQAKTSLRLFEEKGDYFSTTWPLLSLGAIFLAEENFQVSSAYYQQCLGISEQFNYRWSTGNASKYLGKIALSLNKMEAAGCYLHKSLVIAQETGLGREKANLLYEYAVLMTKQNREAEAVGLLTFVSGLPESDLARIEGGSIQDRCSALLAEFKNELPTEVYSDATNLGMNLNLDDVIEGLLEENIFANENNTTR